MSRLYELFFNKEIWMLRLNYLLFGFMMIPMIIGLFTATKCEYQKYQINKEGVYGKR